MHALLTSAAGDHQRALPLAPPPAGGEAAYVIVARSDRPRQAVFGVGSSLTQASAAALSTLSPDRRRAVLELAFGPDGAAFSLVRTHIGSCDFSTSSYCYAPDPDPSLASFSLDVDRQNGHLDLLLDAHAVPGAAFRLIASPWTAPPWMKDNGRYYDREQRRGGRLLDAHLDTFARYTVRYVDALAALGVPTWALTPVNEPHGNNGSWESMEMEPAQQAAYVATLGPLLRAAGHDTRVLVYDQNRTGMIAYAGAVFADPAATSYAWGTAVHWYDATFRVYEDLLDAHHAAWPDRPIVHTEGCIDTIYGKGPPGETPWWRDDGWFWRDEATDWGWVWAEHPEVDHPPYAPALRYARDLVGGLGRWLAGWVDWNLVLDRRGGPNHVGNFCLAPILVDGDEVYVTPLFHVLAQISRHTRPGAVVHEATARVPAGVWAAAVRGPDGARFVHVFNEAAEAVEIDVRWDERAARVTSPARSLLTVVLDGPPREEPST
jgi:glucosylceramidase